MAKIEDSKSQGTHPPILGPFPQAAIGSSPTTATMPKPIAEVASTEDTLAYLKQLDIRPAEIFEKVLVSTTGAGDLFDSLQPGTRILREYISRLKAFEKFDPDKDSHQQAEKLLRSVVSFNDSRESQLEKWLRGFDNQKTLFQGGPVSANEFLKAMSQLTWTLSNRLSDAAVDLDMKLQEREKRKALLKTESKMAARLLESCCEIGDINLYRAYNAINDGDLDGLGEAILGLKNNLAEALKVPDEILENFKFDEHIDRRHPRDQSDEPYEMDIPVSLNRIQGLASSGLGYILESVMYGPVERATFIEDLSYQEVFYLNKAAQAIQCVQMVAEHETRDLRQEEKKIAAALVKTGWALSLLSDALKEKYDKEIYTLPLKPDHERQALELRMQLLERVKPFLEKV